MLKAVSLGHEAVASMCLQMEKWAAEVGKPKRTSGLVLPPEGLEQRIKGLVGTELVKAYM
jgi:polyribonucleotide nucleotidyltransferase